MDGLILGIDCNTGNYAKANAAWAEHNISPRFVASMEQALTTLHDEDYLLIIIIADKLDYLPRLRELTEASLIPVLVIAEGYNHTEKLAALRAGAIAYLGDMNIETTVPCAWFLICQLHQPRVKPVEDLRISTHRNILLCEQCHVVFVNGEKIELTYKVFALLEYMMINAGRVLSHDQIYEYVWEREADSDTRVPVKKLVNRLRQCVNGILDADALIQTAWEKGYKIDTH